VDMCILNKAIFHYRTPAWFNTIPEGKSVVVDASSLMHGDSYSILRGAATYH